MDLKKRNLLLVGIGLALILCCCCSLAAAGAWARILFSGSHGTAQLEATPTAQEPPDQASAAVTAPADTPGSPSGNAAESIRTPPPLVTVAGASTPRPTAVEPALQATAQMTLPAASTAAGAVVSDTESQIASTILPTRDMRSLTLRLKAGATDIPLVVNATPPAYRVGDTISFWVENGDTEQHRQISATLHYVTPHVYMWVDKGAEVDDHALAESARRFETRTYPTDRRYFGSEWTPGVDDDVHLSILHTTGLGQNIAGYYSASDEVSRLVNPYSNEKEMFYISLDSGGPVPGTSFYDGVLAHEFQHMIHWNTHRNEVSWVNEGMSELAAHLNGFDVGKFDASYAARPDTQLTTWADPSQGGSNAEHYGAAYLFLDYFRDRFGDALLKKWAASTRSSTQGLDEVLAGADRPERFNDVFADWLAADYLNRPNAAPRDHFGYPDITAPAPAVSATLDQFPATERMDVSQYGADYFQVKLPSAGDLAIDFSGQPQVGLTGTRPPEKYAWWSNRGDNDDTTLTRAFDLTGLTTATLKFKAWYNIEDGWDYVYCEASTDGHHWQVLPGRHTSTQDASGNAFGPGWTGNSGGGVTPQWINESVDLSAFAGQKVSLRFEYVTDDAINLSGFLLDDVAIPELGYAEDFAQGPGGWQAQGWILTDGTLPEGWLVEAVTPLAHGGAQVQRMDVGPDGQGTLTIKDQPGAGDTDIIVSAEAPDTTERASYTYTVALAP